MNYVAVAALILVLATIGIGIYGINNEIKGKAAKRFLGFNFSTFLLILVAAAVVLFNGSSAHAITDQEALVEAAKASATGMQYLAAALSTGLACIGTGIAVAITGSAAIGAISENESLLGKTIIFVGLAEGIAIYGMIISIMILGAGA